MKCRGRVYITRQESRTFVRVCLADRKLFVGGSGYCIGYEERGESPWVAVLTGKRLSPVSYGLKVDVLGCSPVKVVFPGSAMSSCIIWRSWVI